MAPLAKGDDDADYEDEVVKPRRKRARPTPKECCIRGCAGDGRIRLPLELDAHVKLRRRAHRRAEMGRKPRPRNSTKIALELLQYYLRT